MKATLITIAVMVSTPTVAQDLPNAPAQYDSGGIVSDFYKSQDQSRPQPQP
jgi:hypothetical protein